MHPRKSTRRAARVFAVLGVSVLMLSGCGGSGGGQVTDPGPTGTLTSITIPVPAPIQPGTTQQLAAVGHYSSGDTAVLTTQVTWSSSNDADLAVSNAAGTRGRATRTTDASVSVTATLDGVSEDIDIGVWSTVLATSLQFDGDFGGSGTGFGIGHLVSDANALYWAAFDNSSATGGSIGMVPKAGGTVVTLASGLGGINALATDGAHVYWTEFEIVGGHGAVKRVPVGGGAVEVLASGTPAGSVYDVFFPGGIAVDATYAYWGEGAGGGAIRRVPKAGGTVVDLGRGQGFGPSALAIGGSYLYGVTNNGGTGVAARLPIAGGTVEVLATNIANAADIVVDADGVYWAELVAPEGRVASVALAGGAVTPLATGLDNPRSVAVHGAFVYFAGATGEGVDRRVGLWRVADTGGSAVLVIDPASTQGGADPYTLVVDASYVFYVDGGWGTASGARVLRAPRE